MLKDVEDEVQDVDVEDDLDEVEDAVHNVHADGKVLFCDAAVEEVVVEPPESRRCSCRCRCWRQNA